MNMKTCRMNLNRKIKKRKQHVKDYVFKKEEPEENIMNQIIFEGTKRLIQDTEDRLNRLVFIHENKFDFQDTWSLDRVTLEFLIPRLVYLKEHTNGYPPTCNTFNEWITILDRIIAGFKLFIKTEDIILPRKQTKKIEQALDLYRKYFRNMWD